jgi:hypothetical protein
VTESRRGLRPRDVIALAPQRAERAPERDASSTRFAISRRAWLRAALALPVVACSDPETPPPRAPASPEPTSAIATIALALGPWEPAGWPAHQRFAAALAATIELPAHGLDLRRLARTVARQRRAGEPVSLGDRGTRRVLETIALALYRTPTARGALLGEAAFGCAAR